MFEHSLKNAYIGEYWEYSYSFLWGSATQFANDGWQGTSWWNVDGDGAYRNNWNSFMYITLPKGLNNANKITMTRNGKTWSSGTSDCAFYLNTDASITTGTVSWLYFSYNNYNRFNVWGGGSSFTRSYNWTTTAVAVFDLVNKVWTLTFSNWTAPSPSQWSITDWQVEVIREQQKYIILAQNWTPRIASIKIAVE